MLQCVVEWQLQCGCAGARFLNILPSVIQRLEAAPVHHVVSTFMPGPA